LRYRLERGAWVRERLAPWSGLLAAAARATARAARADRTGSAVNWSRPRRGGPMRRTRW